MIELLTKTSDDLQFQETLDPSRSIHEWLLTTSSEPLDLAAVPG